MLRNDLFIPNTNRVIVSSTILQMKTMRFADEYMANVVQGADDFSARVGTPEAHLAGLKWKLSQSTAVVTDASGINPVINALDLLVLATMSRMVIEDAGVEKFGTNVLPLLEIHRKQEKKIWDMAAGTLNPMQEAELKGMIQDWRRNNPNQRYVGSIRFVEFAAALGKNPNAVVSSSPNSIFSLLFLNPFAGLDPTVASLEETRQFGERLMYYLQRAPQLMSWQAELAVMEMANLPESRQLLTNAQQIAAAAESFSKTASVLPQFLRAEREAAIKQVFDRLDSQETNASATLLNARDAFAAGSDAAKSIKDAIKSLDDFVRYVSPPSTNLPAAPSDEKPFNVLDYGAAASQIGAASRELSATLLALNQSTPQIAKMGEDFAAISDRVVSRAFRLGLVLVVVFVGGQMLLALIRRRQK